MAYTGRILNLFDHKGFLNALIIIIEEKERKENNNYKKKKLS